MPIRIGTSELIDVRYGTQQVLKRYLGETLIWELTSATVPAQIDDLVATPGDEEVSLTWTAPDDGGSAITDYIIQWREVT